MKSYYTACQGLDSIFTLFKISKFDNYYLIDTNVRHETLGSEMEALVTQGRASRVGMNICKVLFVP